MTTPIGTNAAAADLGASLGVAEARGAAPTSEAAAARNEDAPVVLAGRGGRAVGVPAPRTPGDDLRLGRLATALGFFTDPLAMEGFAQSLARDARVEARETSIEGNARDAEAAATERREALSEAASKAKEAGGWELFAQIAVRVAAVAGAVVGTVAGAFTGGAGLVLAAGLIIMAFGNDLAFACKKAGVDADVTNAIGMGATIVGTACTFGAGAAGAGASTAAQGAALVAQQAAKAAELTANVYGSLATISQASLEHRAAMLQADGAEAGLAFDQAHERLDGDAEEAVEFMQSFERVISRLRGAAVARDEAMRAATMQRA